MFSRGGPLSLITATVALFFLQVCAKPLTWNDFISLDNEFIDPKYVLAKNWSSATTDAQQTIIVWADAINAQGPWSVVNKSIIAPTGDPRDYISFAPYYWPNCTGVGNTSALTPQQIATTCPYYPRDGIFNPDYRSVNNSGDFDALCDAVLYDSLAWVITGNDSYAQKAVSFIDTWFINPETAMNPNLNYSQVIRGPGTWAGDHFGVLDLKTMTKIVTGILIFREANFAGWTSDMDSAMVEWSNKYIHWLETNPLGIAEGTFDNNHGTFFYNQMAALQILVGNPAGARQYLTRYFTTQYQSQIAANGEQPLEAARSRSYHYRSYNLCAMTTNAKLGSYVGLTPDPWTTPTKAGSDIQSALNFALTINPNTTDEFTSAPAPELWPNVAAVAAHYGDPKGKYQQYLLNVDANFPAAPWFFWDQPLALPATYQLSPASGIPISGGGDKHSAAPRSTHIPLLSVLCTSILLFVGYRVGRF